MDWPVKFNEGELIKCKATYIRVGQSCCYIFAHV